MFKGLPRGVVVGLGVVLLDIVARFVRGVMWGVSGVRRVVLRLIVCLLSVLNVCMLLVMCKKQKMATVEVTECFCIRNAQRHRDGGVQSWRRFMPSRAAIRYSGPTLSPSGLACCPG
jgi:hypothetical protein